MKTSLLPYINRFLSADTVISSYVNPQNLNRFSYVGNNPLRYTDPSGHMMVEDEESTKGGLDCRKFSRYCKDGRPKSSDELMKMRKPKKEDNATLPIPTITTPPVTQTPSSEESPSSITINWNAVVDPLAWEHIAGGILGGVALIVFGAAVMIPLGADLCTSVVGCAAGIPLIVAGGGAILGGGALVWSGVQFTKVYLDEIFVQEP